MSRADKYLAESDPVVLIVNKGPTAAAQRQSGGQSLAQIAARTDDIALDFQTSNEKKNGTKEKM